MRHLARAPVAFAIIAAALFATAGAVGLFEPTETRYAEIAREMRATGDFLIPRLNGIAHLHKPPFAYWAVGAGMALFGENSWGARLPVALASVCTLAFTWIALRRRFVGLDIPPALALWLSGTMALPFLLGRSVASDPFLAATVAGFWAFAPSPVALALLGLGFLIKGPVLFVPTVLPVLVTAAWARSRSPLCLLGPPAGWALFAAVALPWYIAAAARVPGLLRYLLDNQLWQRFTSQVHHRAGPAWYFAAVLVAGALPWSAAFVSGVARAWRERECQAARLLLAWVFVPLLVFSCSGSKLPAYILPCFPAVAMLAAYGLARGGRFAGLAPALACGTLAVWLAFVFGLAPMADRIGSPRGLALALEQSRLEGEPIVEIRRFNAGLPFYLHQRVRLLDVDRELFFSSGSERDRVFVTADSVVALAARHARVWLLAPGREGELLADSLGLGYRQVMEWQTQTLGFVVARRSRGRV